MNKYMGFYELKNINIPTVPWQQFEAGTKLDPGLLWTVRTAVESGSDTSLPRAVGVTAADAEETGGRFLMCFNGMGIVIYYPYFIAEKSGVMDISGDRTIIEAVDGDLWNLVTDGKRDVTVIVPKESSIKPDSSIIQDTPADRVSFDRASCNQASGDRSSSYQVSYDQASCGIRFIGDRSFLSAAELSELLKYASVIRGRFREEISEGRSIAAEWSYAYNTDINHKPVGGRYLVFYELRSV